MGADDSDRPTGAVQLGMGVRRLLSDVVFATGLMALAGLLILQFVPAEPTTAKVKPPIMLPAESARVEWISPPRQWSGGGYWYRFGPVKGGQAGVMPLHTDRPFHNHPEWEH